MDQRGSNGGPSRRRVIAAAAGLTASTILPVGLTRADESEATPERAIHNNRIRQTICRWCYAKIPLDRLCKIAVQLGYQGIDLVGPDEFPTLKAHGLVGTMLNSHGIYKGLNHRENWDECLAKIRTAIDAAHEAGYPNVICFSGARAGMDPDEGRKNCLEAVKKIIGHAEERNVTLCMELLNSKIDHHDYMCDHTAWGVPLVKQVGSERFKLLYDIYHMQIMEGDIVRTITQHHDCFGHYHTGGIPGRHEIDQTQELHYPAVVRAIVATGYKGWLGQEFLPVHDPVASLAECGRICDV